MADETVSDQEAPAVRRVPMWVAPLALALLTGAVWGITIGHDFVWDDRHFVVQNPALRSWSYLPSYFTDASTICATTTMISIRAAMRVSSRESSTVLKPPRASRRRSCRWSVEGGA